MHPALEALAKARKAAGAPKKPRTAAQAAADARKRGKPVGGRDTDLNNDGKPDAPVKGRGKGKKDKAPSYRGRPVVLGTVRPADLETNAQAFQYKGGGDADGVTQRLKGVETWDSIRAGVMLVHERQDGSRVVIDGHQRTGLAKRLEAEGHEPIQAPAYVFRAKDGWTDLGEMRAIAAARNIAEGSGDMIDAARVFRDYPELANDGALPLKSALVMGARGLSRLRQDAWGMVLMGAADPEHGGIVGHMTEIAPEHQAAVLKALTEAKPRGAREAAMMAKEIHEAGFSREEQAGLFGVDIKSTALIAERAKITTAAIGKLKAEAKALLVAAGASDMLRDRAGNIINVEASEKEGGEDKALAALMYKLASQRGTLVHDLVGTAARRVAEGEKRAKAVTALASSLRREFRAGGITRLMGVGPAR